MNILLTGSSGLIGQALIPVLRSDGHRVTCLVRFKPRGGEPLVYWYPAGGEIDAPKLEGFDAVVHLAGEPITGRWTAAKKRAIRDSRVSSTRLLCKTLARLTSRPRVFVAASASGYYGDRGDEVLREESGAGSSFLSQVCQDWEEATKPTVESGIRVVNLRIGFVLSSAGGGLAKMLPAFRMGAGGKIGSGKQYISWIGIDDLVQITLFAATTETLNGPANAAAPNPVTNLVFTKTLGRVLGRPAIFPMPAFAVRLAFGEMGKELLLASTRLEPARLLNAGYQFRFPQLEGALRYLLGRKELQVPGVYTG
jgi:uncharacterized protein (TIGR01777 family)